MVFLWFMFYCTLCALFSKTNSEQIHSLPGQPKDVTLKQYSGYIVTDDSRGRSFFYYFVEAQSKRSPALVPLTLWLGGAFGCSSVGRALFTENGPFRPRKDGRLMRNPYSWHLVSNMLYVDSPIGSGFSFSSTPSDYDEWNLTTTVNEILMFIVKWFEKFPEFRNSDLYLGGDGKIGHLAPPVAGLVLEYNKKNATPIKLKGLAIGNMGTGTEKYLREHLWYHGVISQEMYTKLKTVCTPEKAFHDQMEHGNMSKKCEKIVNEVGGGIELENLLMPVCVNSNSSLKQHHDANEDIIVDPCLTDYTVDYLNRPEVQKALHINKANLPHTWDVCEGGLKPDRPSKDPYTTKIVHALSGVLKGHIRVLLYSGDQDMIYPVVETRKLADTLAKDMKLIRLRKNGPWYNGPQQIYSLPGQPKNVTLKHYSGYIVTDDSHGKSFFYYFVEAQSRHSPARLPLTLWFGGAHGCSSVGKALFTKNGPFRPGKDGKLIRNAYSWNLESNMLYVDSPIGTGFSFSKTSSDYTGWNPTTTVKENLKFIIRWFQKYPKYKNSDFYLGGDGLIGHLVPQLAALVLEYNKNNATPIKLKGLIIGNLGRGPYKYTDDYLWYHGVISQELYTKLKTVCSSEKSYDEIHRGNTSKDCEKIMSELDKEIGEDVDMDSLLMPICETSNSSLKHHFASEDIVGDPCLFDNTMVYLNRPQVQKALHIDNTQIPYHWDECRGPIKPPLPMKDPYSTKNIHALSALLARHIRILLYSGDQDMTYPVVETRKLADTLAKDLKFVRLRKNGPWYNGPQVGGWSESYGHLREGKNITYLTFASVKGGSHFAPSSSPSQAFTLFKSFLKGSPP